MYWRQTSPVNWEEDVSYVSPEEVSKVPKPIVIAEPISEISKPITILKGSGWGDEGQWTRVLRENKAPVAQKPARIPFDRSKMEILKKKVPFRTEITNKLAVDRMQEAARLKERQPGKPQSRVHLNKAAIKILANLEQFLKKEAVSGFKRRRHRRHRDNGNAFPILWFKRSPPGIEEADKYPFHNSKHKIAKDSNYSRALGKQFPALEREQRVVLKNKKRQRQAGRDFKQQQFSIADNSLDSDCIIEPTKIPQKVTPVSQPCYPRPVVVEAVRYEDQLPFWSLLYTSQYSSLDNSASPINIAMNNKSRYGWGAINNTYLQPIQASWADSTAEDLWGDSEW
eukprot:TRINITY_DN3085_c0_g2_i1.p1 TRINITY_DN3085_c0_g2~~TRINITY_DN3085_c0_g2_i1.p1  ORF type:complete len:352 (+),score=50.17 TRINITY_DN3085_c0_g2_i1:38-1057(+)